MVNRRILLSVLLILSMGTIVIAASSSAQDCPNGLEPVTEFRLFFGLTDAAGNTVTEEEWQQFLADTITPRFKAGLTVLDGQGQRLEPSGSLHREPAVKLMIGAVASDVNQSMKLVDEISIEFQARFKQDPVFRMSNTACAGIYQQ